MKLKKIFILKILLQNVDNFYYNRFWTSFDFGSLLINVQNYEDGIS